MSESSRLVSVIIPAFNRSDLITETVDSVLSQTDVSIELIVVDDGSDDGTFERLEAMDTGSQFTLLTHANRSNKGQSASINLGLRHAKGEYIAILDSDDLFSPGSLSRHAEFLDQNPNVGMVYGAGKAVDACGEPLGYNTLEPYHSETGDPNNLLLDCYIALPGGAMVRREVYQHVGLFEETFRASQDHDMALRIFEATKVAYLPEVAFHYRKHDGSISKNALERRWRTGFEILERAKARYPYHPEIIRKRAAVLNFRLGQTLWRKEQYLIAVPHLVKSALLDPVRAIRVLLGKESLG